MECTYCVPKIIFIFCSIPVTIAVSLRIDGLIDLGPNWSYEYRIVNTNEKYIESSRPEGIFRHRSDPQENERMRRDEERLRKAEERLRKEADELRKIAHQDDDPHKQNQDDVAHSNNKRNHEEKQKNSNDGVNHVYGIHSPKDNGLQTTKQEFDRVKVIKSSKKSEETESDETKSKVTTNKPITFSSGTDESNSIDESQEEAIKNTMIDVYDLTSTTKQKNYQRESEKSRESKNLEKTKKRKDKPGLVNEDAASFVNESNNKTDEALIKRGIVDKKLKFDLENIIKSINLNILNNTEPTTTTSTTTQVTTLRTGEIYTDSHKVKDDAKIIEFTNHLYKQTLKVFDVVKQKTSQYPMKKQVDQLAKSYEDKFKEFLRDTRTQKIKTRLGTQKVILNTIEMSNRILKRLINFMIGDMEKKGVLRHNVATANIFQKEIENEHNLELGHACKKFGICHSGTVFSEYLTDIFTILLRCDDKKFKQTIDALTEVIKNTNYSRVLEPHTERKLKAAIEKVELQDINTLRPMFMIVKNIITNKNKPLVVNNLSGIHEVNATLAVLEIIDLLDQKMPRNESNVLEWTDIKKSLDDFSANQRYDVQEIMEVIMKHLKKTLKGLDKVSQKIVSKSIDIILT